MKKSLIFLFFLCLPVWACDDDYSSMNGNSNFVSITPEPAEWDGVKRASITYQALVYSFADGTGNDKIGDFNGLTSKLDYLDGLGVSAIWLSPIHPASSYHGYNVEDYAEVNPDFGTDADFQNLLDEAAKRDIKIYIDYVINHSSTYNQWFQTAVAEGEGSEYWDYYAFSQDPYADIQAGKIAQIATEGAAGYNSSEWLSTGTSYYYHSAFNTRTMADLNYGAADSAEQSGAFIAITEAADKWVEMGIGGMRLDAVKHIYHNPTSGENPTFLAKFYDRMNSSYKASGGEGDFYMVGEVWDEYNLVAPYYAGLPALFEFSFWDRLKWALNEEIGCYFAKDIIGYQEYYARYRKDYIEATKLSNHDEERTGTTLGGSVDKMKLAGAVLLTAGGEPYIYQGEELGYCGSTSRGDEYVRTPIIWDRAGSEIADAYLNGRVDYSMLTSDISVEAQNDDEDSILNVYRSFTKLRNTYPALAEGKMEAHPVYNGDNTNYSTIAVWYMVSDAERALVVHNFGSVSKTLEFDDDLSKPVGLLGSAKVSSEGATDKLYIGAYSSVVFDLNASR